MSSYNLIVTVESYPFIEHAKDYKLPFSDQLRTSIKYNFQQLLDAVAKKRGTAQSKKYEVLNSLNILGAYNFQHSREMRTSSCREITSRLLDLKFYFLYINKT